jgi:hypothetical protein
MIQKPINLTLPASDDAGGADLISLPTTQTCSDYAIQARGNVDMKISDVQDMTTYWTVKAGTAQSLAEIFGVGGVALFYAISGGAASVVEVLPLKNKNY